MKALKLSGLFMALAAIGLASAPVAQAQVEEFDPNSAVGTNYNAPEYPEASAPPTTTTPPSSRASKPSLQFVSQNG